MLEGWARDGLSLEQIAKNMGVADSTLRVWIQKFPAISAAIKRGQAPVDIEVENALLKRALGFECEETVEEIEETPTGKYDPDGKPIVKTKKHLKRYKKFIPGDTTAMIFWLKNRKPEQWKDKREQVVSTKDGVLADLISGLKEPVAESFEAESG